MKLLPIKIFFGCLLFFNPASASQALPDDLITYMDSLDISYTPIDDKDFLLLQEFMANRMFALLMISMVMIESIMRYW